MSDITNVIGETVTPWDSKREKPSDTARRKEMQIGIDEIVASINNLHQRIDDIERRLALGDGLGGK